MGETPDEPMQQRINLSDVEEGPVRGEKLPDDLLRTIRSLYDDVGRYVKPTLEQWELGFKRDAHPEREVRVWCAIALAWHDYHKNHINNTRLSDEDEEKLVGALAAISSGVTEAGELKLPPQTAEGLLESWRTITSPSSGN